MKICLIISLFFLIGCTTTKTQPLGEAVIKHTYLIYDCGMEPTIDNYNLDWRDGWVVQNGMWTLLPDHYGLLGDNVADIIKGIQQQDAVITFYRNCIIKAKSIAEDKNESTKDTDET